MTDQSEKQSIQHTVTSASTFLIILKSHPSFDQVATAIALHLALQNAKKHSHIACEHYNPQQFSSLIGNDLVHQNVGNHSLQITFDYSDDMVENVSYNIDQERNKFSLVIRPKKNHPPLDPSTVEFNHVGIDAEVIFMIGVAGFEEIGQFYSGEENAFTQARTIAIHRQPTTFAEENWDISTMTSFSEFIIHKLKEYKFEIDRDIATNLLAGIESATNSLQSPIVSADTFENVAKLMRAGAKRIQRSTGFGSNVAGSNPLAQALAAKPAPTQVQPQPPKQPMQIPSQFAPSLK